MVIKINYSCFFKSTLVRKNHNKIKKKEWSWLCFKKVHRMPGTTQKIVEQCTISPYWHWKYSKSHLKVSKMGSIGERQKKVTELQRHREGGRERAWQWKPMLAERDLSPDVQWARDSETNAKGGMSSKAAAFLMPLPCLTDTAALPRLSGTLQLSKRVIYK